MSLRTSDDPREVAATIIVIALLGILLWATVASAQPAFPARGVEIVNELYAGVNPQDDNARRVSIHRTCAQMVHDIGPKWGNKKRAGLSDDFRSPDSIAYLEDDGAVSVWDIQASSGQILVHAGKPPDYPRLSPSEAAFMPCTPANYLNPAPPPPVVVHPPVPGPGPVVPTPGTPDLSNLSSKIDMVLTKVDRIDATTTDTREDVKVIRSGMNRVITFIGKYIVPPLAAGITAWFAKPEDKP
jgi:hypothetical protein